MVAESDSLQLVAARLPSLLDFSTTSHNGEEWFWEDKEMNWNAKNTVNERIQRGVNDAWSLRQHLFRQLWALNSTRSTAWFNTKHSYLFRSPKTIKCVRLPVCVSLVSWSESLNASQGGRWKRESADVWKVDKGDSYLIIKNLTRDTSIHLWAWRLMEADLMWLISLE